VIAFVTTDEGITMARPRKKRAARWSWSTGERGANRVRVFEHPVSGLLYFEWFESRPEMRPVARTRNLGHNDKDQAKAEAFDFAAQLLRGEVPRKVAVETVEEGPLTLGKLFDNYLAEVTPEKKSAPHDKRASKLFLKLWGRDKVVRSLSERDWKQFIRLRRSGELAPEGRPEKDAGMAVRDRVIEEDLRWLRAVLNWALKLKDANGDFVLAVDPLRGLKIPKEANPVRTVLSEADYAKLLEVAPKVGDRFELALVLCSETGHRISSVRSLRWADVDLTAGVVAWPAEFDKVDNQHKTPLSEPAVAALKAYRARQAAIAGWIFPGQDGTAPLERGRFYAWWRLACTLAEIDRPKGAFHTMRRRFATDRLGVPLKTLAALGGWKDTRTLVECYQHPDMEQLREALVAPRKLLSGPG
jgi:integrase